MEKIIVLKGIAVPYELQRKNIRRMNLRVHRDGRVLVSASRDTAQWEIEAFLLGNADFVLQNRERCLKLIEAGDGISAGKIDAMKMGMCSISVEKPAAFVLGRAGKSRWSGSAV